MWSTETWSQTASRFKSPFPPLVLLNPFGSVVVESLAGAFLKPPHFPNEAQNESWAILNKVPSGAQGPGVRKTNPKPGKA